MKVWRRQFCIPSAWRPWGAALVAMALFAVSAVASPLEQTGYSLLVERLGADAPAAAGVVLGQVEVCISSNYLPDASISQFAGKTLTPMSGTGGVSSHATTVGANYYGLYASPAPAATDIRAYAVDDWASTVLRYNRDVEPVGMGDVQVVNHSWIQDNEFEVGAEEILQRADYLVERDGVVMVAGVNNGSETDLPWVMSSAYNAIVVGVTSLDHSAGPTTVDQPGRSKPDLVAPHSRTSYATPLVGAAAAGLLGEATQRGWQDAHRPEVVKSILMAGAAKSATWQTVGDEPLDRAEGAGSLRVDRSWRIFEAGGQDPDQFVPPAGWSAATAQVGDTDTYILSNPAPVAELTAQLSWLREHSGSWTYPETTLDRLALRAYRGNELLDVGRSTVDNIQHLRLRNLPAGFTRLEVELLSDEGSSGARYGLAWMARLLGDLNEDGQVLRDDLTLFPALLRGESRPGLDADAADWDRDAVLEPEDLWSLARQLGAAGPGDVNLDGEVDLSDLAVLSSHWGLADGSGDWFTADFDGDGNVLLSDLHLLAANWTGEQPLRTMALLEEHSVPEPVSVWLLLAGGIGLVGRRGSGGNV